MSIRCPLGKLMVLTPPLSQGSLRNINEKARWTPLGRAELVGRVLEAGQSRSALARGFCVCPNAVHKWVERFQALVPAPAVHGNRGYACVIHFGIEELLLRLLETVLKDEGNHG